MFGLLLTEISSLRNADNRHLNASWLSSCVLCAKRLFLNISQWWHYMQWLCIADSLLKAFKTLYGDSILSCLVLISYKSCCNAVVNSPWLATPLTIIASYTGIIIIQIDTLIHNQLIYTCLRNALFLHIILFYINIMFHYTQYRTLSGLQLNNTSDAILCLKM